MVVDSEPRSSSADQALFGGKMFPRVKTISCGGTGRIRTQHASKNSPSPTAFLVSTVLTVLLLHVSVQSFIAIIRFLH